MKTFLLFISFLTLLISSAQKPVTLDIDSLFTITFPNQPIVKTSKTNANGLSYYVQFYNYNNDLEEFKIIKRSSSDWGCASDRQEMRDIYKEAFNTITDTISKQYIVDSYAVSIQNNIYLGDLYFTAGNRKHEFKIVQVKDTLYKFTYNYHVYDSNLKNHSFNKSDFLNSLKPNFRLIEKEQYSICYDNSSSPYNNGYKFGKMIAPFICLGFSILLIGSIIMIIINIQKKKKKKQQDEFDQYDL